MPHDSFKHKTRSYIDSASLKNLIHQPTLPMRVIHSAHSAAHIYCHETERSKRPIYFMEGYSTTAD